MTKKQLSTADQLRDTFDRVEKAAMRLHRSSERLESTIDWLNPSEDDLDRLDTFAIRFARLEDIMLQKVFRVIDILEGIELGSPIDVANRAEKRGLIESSHKFREIRELRNEITHEYAVTDLPEIARQLLDYTPELLKAVNQAQKYGIDLLNRLS